MCKRKNNNSKNYYASYILHMHAYKRLVCGFKLADEATCSLTTKDNNNRGQTHQTINPKKPTQYIMKLRAEKKSFRNKSIDKKMSNTAGLWLRGWRRSSLKLLGGRPTLVRGVSWCDRAVARFVIETASCTHMAK